MYPINMPRSQKADVRRYQTAPDMIADALRDEIQAGALEPGLQLRQEEIAARFAVSRMPVRDALVRLQAEGLVDLFPNRGAFVAQLTPDEIREIYELRLMLEGDLLARAVPNMTPASLDALAATMAKAEKGAHGPHWRELDDEFHAALYEPAHRPHQLEIVSRLRRTVQRYAAAYETLPQSTARWLADHRKIVTACRRKSPDAARAALEAHLRRAGDFVLTRQAAR